MVGGGVLSLCTSSSSSDSDWNDCVRLCMRFHSSGLVTHVLYKMNEPKLSSIYSKTLLTVCPEKSLLHELTNLILENVQNKKDEQML